LDPLLVRNPLLNDHFATQTEVSLPSKQHWKQLPLWWKGKRNDENCSLRFPRTCELLRQHIPDATGNFGGFIKFSALTAGTHVPQHCGPHNARIRMHLGVVIPNNRSKIKINGHTQYVLFHAMHIGCIDLAALHAVLRVYVFSSWEEGRVLMIDDSYEHEVWYDLDEAGMNALESGKITEPGVTAPVRVILIVDVWHPELPERFKRDTSLGAVHPHLNYDFYY
jgi:aspartate beta-hydroxylase